MFLKDVIQWLDEHRLDKTVVLVTGVFDLLHEEHLNFLQKAKDEGHILIVGIESDLRVKQLKGENRPIWKQEQRMIEIKRTQIADVVFILPEQFSKPADHENLIAQIRPTVLAVSSHTNHQDKKRAIVEKFGGVLAVVYDHNPAVSTTRKLEKS